eukprot:3644368-Pyramimonas_sp.AAC.1
MVIEKEGERRSQRKLLSMVMSLPVPFWRVSSAFVGNFPRPLGDDWEHPEASGRSLSPLALALGLV